MILLTAIAAMFCVYHWYDTGLILGFMTALCFEVICLLLLYNLLKRTEERVRREYDPLLDGMREKLQHQETQAGKRLVALQKVVAEHPDLAEMVEEVAGETLRTTPPPGTEQGGENA